MALAFVAGASSSFAQTRPERARDLGIPLDGTPGSSNAITDVPGVEVGHATIIRGSGRLVVGQGPVRTGVTAVLPRGRRNQDAVFAGWFSLNGNGEMTGTPWLDDYGLLLYPIMITNTNSVGTVRDAIIDWGRTHVNDAFNCCLPLVTETWDGELNDIFGFHVKREHVVAAIDSARPGPVREGNVGGGTGMICLGYKGGIGTSSRKLSAERGGYTIGVLVQCNFGRRAQLRVAGIPADSALGVPPPCYDTTEPLDSALDLRRCSRAPSAPSGEHGSIIVVIATDAPLLPHQLRRLAKRASLGIARMGSIAGASSGDLFVAFSTMSTGAAPGVKVRRVEMLDDMAIDPVYEAVVQGTEEAVLNAMLAATTMTGANWLRVPALPHDRLRQVLAKAGRLKP